MILLAPPALGAQPPKTFPPPVPANKPVTPPSAADQLWQTAVQRYNALNTDKAAERTAAAHVDDDVLLLGMALQALQNEVAGVKTPQAKK